MAAYENISTAYTKTYTSFSGADIVASFDDQIVGELQAISYSVTREKAPIYTMGSADPRSFSRGKRGIAGSLVFTVFNKDAFDKLKQNKTYTTPYANAVFRQNMMDYLENGEVDGPVTGDPDTWEDAMANDDDAMFATSTAFYVDEIPPFTITITMMNEYGQAARFALIGVEILNEGMGMSIDDITTEKACTFVARGITPIETVTVSAKDMTRK